MDLTAFRIVPYLPTVTAAPTDIRHVYSPEPAEFPAATRTVTAVHLGSHEPVTAPGTIESDDLICIDGKLFDRSRNRCCFQAFTPINQSNCLLISARLASSMNSSKVLIS